MDLITPAVTGVGGALVKEVGSKGISWLVDLVSANSPKVQQRAIRNLENFLVRLARRVELLETELPASKEMLFRDALEDPETYLLLRKASTVAGATENDDRHSILAELIVQRMTAAADDRVALAGGAACDVVASLSSRQIRLLAVTAALVRIRPNRITSVATQEEYAAACLTWWNRRMSVLVVDDLQNVSALDLEHLAALSCIWIQAREMVLGEELFKLASEREFILPIDELRGSSWWPVLGRLFAIGLRFAQLTSVGVLVGALHHDCVLRTKTKLAWEDPADQQ